MKNLSWRTNMFSKKVLIIGLMAVALMSYSIAALAEDNKDGTGSEIFISLLQTPPPGYVLEKSFGKVGFVSKYSAILSTNEKDVFKLIDEADKGLQEVVKKLGGNAILAESITTLTDQHVNIIYVIMQGEVVLLKPVKK